MELRLLRAMTRGFGAKDDRCMCEYRYLESGQTQNKKKKKKKKKKKAEHETVKILCFDG
jgi:hypothetical protein